MTKNNGRCPICRGYLVWSFIDESEDHYTVYRCTRCTSSDERLFIQYQMRWIEVRAVRRGGKEPRWYAVAISDEELKKAHQEASERRRFAEVQSAVNTAIFFEDLERFNRARRAREILTGDPALLVEALLGDA